jgi:hypothetical protein
MKTLAHQLYDSIDGGLDLGVRQQVSNFCVEHDRNIELLNDHEVVFYDGSSVIYDDNSITLVTG